MKILLIFFIFFSIIINWGFSQNINIANNDNNSKKHSPRKATIYSTLIPGLGQAYNKKYWKIPVVYAGLGTLTFFTIENNNEFNRFKNAYLKRQNDEIDEFYDILNEQALLNEMDRWRKYRDYCIIGVIALYILQIVDANVDANLYHFDVSDDLSLKISPQLNSDYFHIYSPNIQLKFVKRF